MGYRKEMEYFVATVIISGLFSIGWFVEHHDRPKDRRADVFGSLQQLEEDYRSRYGRYANRIYDLDGNIMNVLEGLKPLEIHREVPLGGTSLRLRIVTEGEVFSYRSPGRPAVTS